MAYQRTAEERGQEIEMMQSPARWPAWPMLPLKRKDTDGPMMGLLLEVGLAVGLKVESTVYLTNLFEFPGMSLEARREVKFLEYSSFEALLDDGWVVD